MVDPLKIIPFDYIKGLTVTVIQTSGQVDRVPTVIVTSSINSLI